MTKSELEELVLELRKEVSRLIEIVEGWQSDGIDEDEVEIDPDKALSAASAVISFADWATTHEGVKYWEDVYGRLLGYAESE